MKTPAIEASGLTKYYGPHRGIVDIDLEVAQGQVFGFLGPNGAGKSTTMRVLMDFHRPTRGRASMLGLDCQGDTVALKRRVGYLSGDIALHERLTAHEQLEWLGDLRGGVDRERIERLADRLGLDLGRPIRELSKGNRQKVGLVQAFMHDPELLILDEPTTGLDPLVQHTFQQMVREVAAEGRTVFLSSHIIDEVDRACDRVAIIREGRLLAVETIEALRARSIRHVRITFAGPVDPGPFDALEDVRSVDVDGAEVEIRTTGDIDPIVKLAARHRVLDFVSEQADLEAVFLAFYGAEAVPEGDVGDDTGDTGDTADERPTW
jgi:ABC-2 type transport system ATP-binding protein